MSNYSNPPPPSAVASSSSASSAAAYSSSSTAASSSTYLPNKVQTRSYLGKFNRIYRPYEARFEKNRPERKSKVPQDQESKPKENFPEKMFEIKEDEGDLIDLLDLGFEHVEEEDDFIAHSLGIFKTDSEPWFEKGVDLREFY